MKKRLLMIAALMLTFVGSSFALNVGDYAYNKTQRLKITGANLVTNGNFANARDGWTDAEGNALSAEIWDFVEGVGPNGENVLQSLGSGSALCNKWVLPEAGGYVVKYDIKGSTTNAIRTSSVGANYCDFFLMPDGALTKVASTEEAPVVSVAAEGVGYKDEGQNIV